MLSQPAHNTRQPSISAELSVSANNFSKYNEHWLSMSTFSFGKSGEQLRLNKTLPLSFPKPERNALRTHTVSREPILGDYVYKREAITEKEVIAALSKMKPEELAVTLDNFPLSDAAQAKLDRDEVAHKRDLDLRIKDDNECHAMLAANISAASQSSIRLHVDYQAYVGCAEPYHRSLLFHRILASLHKFGDASTKHARTSVLFHSKQEGNFLPFLDDFNGKFDQFIADFESPDQVGYVHLGELKSFLVLNAVDRRQFRPVFDEQLRSNPTGRFPDSVALIKILSDYDHHHKMSLADPVSHQGSAFAAPVLTIAPALSSTGDDVDTRFRKPRTNKVPCPIHLKKYPKNPHFGHTAAECSLNPASKNYKALAATTATTTFATDAVPEPTDAPTVASLLLSQRRLEQSLASFIAAFSLDQGADPEA